MIRSEPEEACPPSLAIPAALQIFVINTISLMLLLTVVVRASGQSDGYLSWVTFSGLTLTGLSIILHSLRFPYVGSGRLIVTNFNVPFLAASALALSVGGPGLLASLMVFSTLIQFVLTLRLASLRRIFTPTVTGTVIMLVALSAVPFILERTIVAPAGVSLPVFLAPGLVALVVGVGVYLRGSPAWRLWILPIMVAAGLAVAAPLGFYDIRTALEAPWFALPALTWHGFNLTLGRDFWLLLPVFLCVNLTAYLKTLGDLSLIYQGSYRKPVAVDLRTVQSGLNLYSGSTMLTGLLGTLPVTAPWAVTVVYISFTGVAARIVGVYLGLFTLAVAPLAKFIALLVAIPSPVVGAVYVIIFGMLFVEGAKTAFGGQVEPMKFAIAGVSLVLGLSAGTLAELLEGAGAMLISNTVVVGGAVALGMTVFAQLTARQPKRLEVELATHSLSEIDGFLQTLASEWGWSDPATSRLRLVGEEVVLTFLEDGAEDASRRLIVTAQPESAAAELEFIVFADDTIKGNIEDQLAYLNEDTSLEASQEFSLRILRHYTAAVRHRKYYGIDIVSVRVDS
ncbi:MAG: hypothetical protein F4X83_05795 [Chloroflexi bacterium]|nr:hypothetical protein [Chloroflexota bacterium]